MIPRISPNYSWRDIIRCFIPAKRDAIKLLEEEFCKMSHHNNAVSFKYGRSGLFFLLKALGANGKKVIMPSYTCVVVANAVVLSGNIPVFLDNAACSLQPDPKDYLTAIDSDTVMIIPTHLFGISEDVEELYKEVKQKHPGIFVLQDCAHSFFCEDSAGNPVTVWGDGALFGMNISKLINSVKGGMLTLKDNKVAYTVRHLSQEEKIFPTDSLLKRIYVLAAAFAFSRFFYKIVYSLVKHTSLLKSQTDYYDPSKIDLPKDFAEPMTSFEATIGLESLRKYEERVKKRKHIAHIYMDVLKDVEGIMLPKSTNGNTWSHFPLLVPERIRDHLVTVIEKKCSVEIGRIIDYSVSDLPAYQNLNYEGSLKANRDALTVINLPLCFSEGLFGIVDDSTIIRRAEFVAITLVKELKNLH